MPKQSKPKAKKRAPRSTPAGRALLASRNQALAYARAEHVPGIRVTYVQVGGNGSDIHIRLHARVGGQDCTTESKVIYRGLFSEWLTRLCLRPRRCISLVGMKPRPFFARLRHLNLLCRESES